jgi:hypothetical protein
VRNSAGVEDAIVDEQAVGHGPDREAPEADHPVAVIEVDAGQRVEDLGDIRGPQAGAGCEPIALDWLAFGE